jgi:hypothetical protein
MTKPKMESMDLIYSYHSFVGFIDRLRLTRCVYNGGSRKVSDDVSFAGIDALGVAQQRSCASLNTAISDVERQGDPQFASVWT